MLSLFSANYLLPFCPPQQLSISLSRCGQTGKLIRQLITELNSEMNRGTGMGVERGAG